MDERLIDFVDYVRTRPGVTSVAVADHFGVSVRTVRNWLHDVNEALDGAAAVSSYHGSYTLVIHSQARFERLISIGNTIWSRTPSTSDRRVAFLLSNLLFRSDWVTIDALAEELFVTRRTISTNLKEVERELGTYGLRLVRRSHHGIRVEGNELARRRCLSRLIVLNVDYSRNPLTPGYAIIGSTTVGTLSDSAREVLDAYGLGMPGTAFRSLMVHLCISLGRANSGGAGTIDEEMLTQIQSAMEYPVAVELATRASDLSGIELSELDTAYLVLCLVGLRAVEDGASGRSFEPTKEASSLVDEALAHVDAAYHLHLLDAHEVRSGLYARITSLCVRLRYGVDCDMSPLVEGAQKIYPLAFAIATEMAAVVGDHLGVDVPDEEVGALGLYLARMLSANCDCADGVRVLAVGELGYDDARLLERRLRDGLGSHASQLTVRSSERLEERDFEYVDVVLSSVALPDDVPVEVVPVSALPSEEEMGRVRLALARLPRLPRRG